MWDKLVIPSGGQLASREDSLTLIYTRARNRSRRVLEHLFRAYSTEVLEAVIDCWYEQVAVCGYPRIHVVFQHQLNYVLRRRPVQTTQRHQRRMI